MPSNVLRTKAKTQRGGGGEGISLLIVRRLGQVVAFGPSKDERLSLSHAVSEDTLKS